MQTLLKYTGEAKQDTTVKLFSYNESFYEEKDLSKETFFRSHFKEGYQHWLQICGMNDTSILETIFREFNMKMFVAEIMLNMRYPAKIDARESEISVIFNAFSYVNKRIKKERIGIILGDNFLITIEEFPSGTFNPIRQMLQENTYKYRQRKTDILLYKTFDIAIENYAEIVNQIEIGLENLEAELLNYNKTDKNFGKRIQHRKQEYMRLKKTIIPLKEQFSKLIRVNPELITPEDAPYFNDINDQLQSLIHSLDACREITSSLVDIYMSNNDLKMNSIMKQLTIVSTIFIPLTFLVGVWGMNFTNMPELGWKYGYLAFWILTVLLAIIGWIYFKRKKWF